MDRTVKIIALVHILCFGLDDGLLNMIEYKSEKVLKSHKSITSAEAQEVVYFRKGIPRGCGSKSFYFMG